MKQGLEDLRAALANAGIPYTGHFIVDDKIKRYKTAGDHDESCWYVLHQFPNLVAGAFGCWRRNLMVKWSSIHNDQMTPEQRHDCAKKWQEQAQERARQEQQDHKEAAKKVAAIIQNSTVPDNSHPYLKNKQVSVLGNLRLSEDGAFPGWLLVPLQDIHKNIHSAQFISTDGDKRFQYRGRVKACFFHIPSTTDGPLVICEGYATAASIHQATGWEVFAAMSAGNLLPVAQDARKQYPNRTIIIAADNDQFTEKGNRGVTDAKAAAKQTKSAVSIPTFSDEHLQTKPTDFNDLHLLAGLDEVREQIERADPHRAIPWIDAGQAARDADIVLGPGRWITRGAGVLFVGYTGAGKSTWTATQSFSWALGRESLGMRPTSPLKSLVFQAEDDNGDLGAMAESILAKLSPTNAEREQIRRNVLVRTESAHTGVEFLLGKVAPALRRYAPDLLWLNPISTYFGADLNDQHKVAHFFRNVLNPLLLQYRCACFIVHHCPKPSKERKEWTGGQLAYAGAGSADMANWAREVITIRETSLGLFEMSLAKRWRKIGWSDHEGRPTATRFIAHDRKGGQVWLDATPDVLEDLGAKPYSDAALLALVPDKGIDHAELVRLAADTFSVTERTAKKYVNDARRKRRRNVNGKAEPFALLDESTKPRREVYPDKPQGRDVIWLSKAVRETG